MKPLALVMFTFGLACAQQVAPHIGYVYPAGGQAGTTFDVIAGGQFLDNVKKAYVSGTGIEATVVEYFKPITQGQFNRLREELAELVEKKRPEDATKIAEIRKKMSTFVRRPGNPAIIEQVTVRVTVPANVPPGDHELRLGTPQGVTNPLLLRVGQFTEFSKKPAKTADLSPFFVTAKNRAPAKPGPPEPPMLVTLPATINGQILPGTVDKFRFQANQGQKLVILAAARELIPYISDAVPGWFQAIVALRDPQGKEVQYADHFRFHPDPVLFYEIAATGEYTLEIKDSIYRGREDFVYRITAGELPYITSIFPMGGKPGARQTIDLKGYNLPVTKLTQSTKSKENLMQQISVAKGSIVSNALPFEWDLLPQRNEVEPNNTPQKAMVLKLPVVVNGHIDKPGDWDVFKIDGHAGEEIVAEVFARRLDSPLDSILKLTDASGKQLAVNDDMEDKGSGLLTHHADSRIAFKLPANGTYYLHLGDAQSKGGPDFGYRLRLNHPVPDFELRVVPASIAAKPGSMVTVTVFALRKDGFNGDIALKLKDAPSGFMLSGGWVPAGQDQVRLTLTAPAKSSDHIFKLHLDGQAIIAGKEVHRAGVPAEDMMQAFAYHHLVPAQEWVASVSGAARVRTAWKSASDKPVRLPSGGLVPVKLSMQLGRFAGSVHFELNNAPEGIAIKHVATTFDGIAITLLADASKIKPGLKGNLIVDAYTERFVNPLAAGKKETRKQTIGTLPAIPFEVVAQ